MILSSKNYIFIREWNYVEIYDFSTLKYFTFFNRLRLLFKELLSWKFLFFVFILDFCFQFKLVEDEIMRNEAAGEGNAQELINKIRDLVSAFFYMETI